MNGKNEISVSEMMEKIVDSLNLPEKAFFFDTTLRDGEQTPGISFAHSEKLSIAQALNELGIDIIEAGFPAVSQGDFEACRDIAKMGMDIEVIGLARMRKEDIDRVIDADLDSIHVFIATSDLHLKSKLQMTREEILEQISKMITYAKEHYSTILFSVRS